MVFDFNDFIKLIITIVYKYNNLVVFWFKLCYNINNLTTGIIMIKVYTIILTLLLTFNCLAYDKMLSEFSNREMVITGKCFTEYVDGSDYIVFSKKKVRFESLIETKDHKRDSFKIIFDKGKEGYCMVYDLADMHTI
jgi:hypothetical protein